MSALVAIMGVVLVFLVVAVVFLVMRLRMALCDYRWLQQEQGKRLEGVRLIEEERNRQIAEEGWTAEHDDREHCSGQLARAAVCYALLGWSWETGFVADARRRFWPWARGWWKPSDCYVRNLVKAGALIAAEIDRLKRREVRVATMKGPFEKRDVNAELGTSGSQQSGAEGKVAV